MGSDSNQVRFHGGHSHGHGHGGHHHHHDTTYLTSTNKRDPGVRITRIGLYVNLGMAIAKGAGGYVFNSKALTADALHALTDLLSDIATLLTISYSLRPATSRYPFGYGKFESWGAMGVSGLLLLGGVGIGMQALMALSQQFFPEMAHFLEHVPIIAHSHDHGHAHGAVDIGPNINAAWLAGGSIIIKEWLYRATMKVAVEKRSSVLASNAYHHRVDSLTAVVALITICASRFLHNAQWLDPVGGLIISGMIVQAGWGNTVQSFRELADVSIDAEVRESILKAAREAVATDTASEIEIRGVQGIKSGQNYLVEMEVGVSETCTVAETLRYEEEIRRAVGEQVRGVSRVNIRFVKSSSVGEPFEDLFIARKEDGLEHDEEHAHACDGGGAHDHEHKSEKKGAQATSTALKADKMAIKRTG